MILETIILKYNGQGVELTLEKRKYSYRLRYISSENSAPQVSMHFTKFTAYRRLRNIFYYELSQLFTKYLKNI